jgi:TRAP-type mannitol/chloroaromatic compound transport system permease large subunit
VPRRGPRLRDAGRHDRGHLHRVPISFTLLFLALVFGGFGLGWEQTFNLAYLQIWGTMKDEIFPAVPLFIFMGFMTEQAGLMERLFRALPVALSA